MLRNRNSLKPPTIAFCLSLAASVLAFIFIGFPATCGFTGRFGDDIARTAVCGWIALGLFLLPILGVIASVIWWLRMPWRRPALTF